MIVAKNKNNIKLSQKNYNKIFNNINFSNIICNKCGNSNWYNYCRYLRRVDFLNLTYKILIMRVQCKSCKITHAVLIATMIPYTSLSHDDIITITDPNITNNIDIDETYMRFIINKYSNTDYHDYKNVCDCSKRNHIIIFTP